MMTGKKSVLFVIQSLHEQTKIIPKICTQQKNTHTHTLEQSRKLRQYTPMIKVHKVCAQLCTKQNFILRFAFLHAVRNSARVKVKTVLTTSYKMWRLFFFSLFYFSPFTPSP